MRYILTFIALVSIALPAAAAVEVTNLDDVSHEVLFTSTPNSVVRKVAAPNETVRFYIGRGRVQLADDPQPGGGRLALENDVFTIWGDGKLQIQMRRTESRGD
ncbi:MAG: hypothetical protein CMM94_06055 [Rickettsiales bacterium]|nr:hypothetical protein [Rickettsiales bacterium]|tara:strand:- start:39 stop:347 length:309 start_codon:yes stop_codon:yes gene_type:complete